MNAEEYAAYRAAEPNPVTLSLTDVGSEDGTLAYGYTTARDTWHAYVAEAKIHVVVYDYYGTVLARRDGSQMEPWLLRPNKRVYPETVRPQFAYAMRDADCELPFIGNYTPEKFAETLAKRGGPKLYYGLTLNTLGELV